MFSFAGLLQLRVAGSSELLTVTCPSLSEAENIADLIDGYCRLVNNSPTSIWMRRGKIRTPLKVRYSRKAIEIWKKISQLYMTLKWSFARDTGWSGSGKNKKSWFFLLGLKYTLRTCFESKNFSSNSCPELSNQAHSFSACQSY